jgi:hypothetical protein
MHAPASSGRAARAASLVSFAWLLAIAPGCFVSTRDGGGSSSFGLGAGGSGGYGGSGGAGGVGGGGGGGGGSGGGVGGSGGVGAGGTGGNTSACTGGATSNFQVGWTIDDPSGAPASCAVVGAATMDLDVLNLGSNVSYHGSFACGQAAGSTCELPAGQYSFAMRLRDVRGTQLLEAVFPEILSIASGHTNDLGIVPFEVVEPGGTQIQYIAFSWTLQQFSTGGPLDCASAAAATVELDVGQQKFSFPCSAGQGVSAPLAPGTYPVSMQVLDAQQNQLSVTNTANVTISPDWAVEIGNVVFGI